jgi:glycosyltransferase involved in cell wall biosynthesis
MSSLRILLIVENLPYPSFKGGDLRNWQNVNGLMKFGQVGVFGLCSNDARFGKAPREGIVLWLSSKDPMLAFPPAEDRNLAGRAWLFSESGHPADIYYSERAAAELEDIASDFDPQVVVIERLWLHRYIEHVKRPHRRIVLDSHNVEAALYREIAHTIDGNDFRARLMRDALPARTEMIERQAIQGVDQVWVCSGEDEQLIRSAYGSSAPTYVVPNGVEVDSYDAARERRYEHPKAVHPKGKCIIFPAMFAYSPNARAAHFLIEEVFPRLVAFSKDCQLLLVGSMPTPQMIDMAKNEQRLLVTGAVADVRPYLASASATVVPLFEGSGTRYKILEAFAAKVPVISTAKGAQGLEVRNGEHLLIAETAAEFAEAVEKLWVNECLASKLTERALSLVKERYSWGVINGSIENAIHELGLRSS